MPAVRKLKTDKNEKKSTRMLTLPLTREKINDNDKNRSQGSVIQLRGKKKLFLPSTCGEKREQRGGERAKKEPVARTAKE